MLELAAKFGPSGAQGRAVTFYRVCDDSHADLARLIPLVSERREMIADDAIQSRNCCKILTVKNIGGVKVNFEHSEASTQEERQFALVEVRSQQLGPFQI